MIDDKLYIIIILAMMGFFVYYYQKQLDNNICRKCEKYNGRKNKFKQKKSNIKKIDTTDKKKLHKTVKFKDDEISLDSLDSSDHVGSVSNNDDNDSKSCDTLDI